MSEVPLYASIVKKTVPGTGSAYQEHGTGSAYQEPPRTTREDQTGNWVLFVHMCSAISSQSKLCPSIFSKRGRFLVQVLTCTPNNTPAWFVPSSS